MNPSASYRPSTASPLLPSAFPNDESHHSPRKPSSRASSARQSPALRDDLPLPDSTPVPYISVSQQELLPPRSFQPFFAIVEDGRTGEVAHPSVHYVFSDDDPDVITAASLRSLGADEIIPLSPKRSRVREGEGYEQEVEEYGRDTALPPVRPGVEERYILLDVAEDGQSIASARSLSREWAVTGTSIRNAPTFDGSSSDSSAGLMLKVEGMGMGSIARLEQNGPGRAEKLLEDKKRGVNGDTIAAMAQLVGDLRKGMDTLGRVVGNGDGQGSREEE